jgi:hypothetical protein
MKTIRPTQLHRDDQRFALRVMIAPPSPGSSAPEEIPDLLATHDFLVLSTRPDLTPQNGFCIRAVTRT